MTTELTKFLDIMQDVGFDLIKYYADVYYRHETSFESTVNVVHNKEAEFIYSGCWYGGYFFQWLFPSPSTTINILDKNMFVHGEFCSDRECHYFFIITNDTKAMVFSTYGGIPELITNTLSLDNANELLARIKDNDVSAIESFFNITPSYEIMEMFEVKLTATTYQTMSKQYLLSKIDELINKAHTMEDQGEISRLRVIVDEY